MRFQEGQGGADEHPSGSEMCVSRFRRHDAVASHGQWATKQMDSSRRCSALTLSTASAEPRGARAETAPLCKLIIKARPPLWPAHNMSLIAWRHNTAASRRAWTGGGEAASGAGEMPLSGRRLPFDDGFKPLCIPASPHNLGCSAWRQQAEEVHGHSWVRERRERELPLRQQKTEGGLYTWQSKHSHPWETVSLAGVRRKKKNKNISTSKCSIQMQQHTPLQPRFSSCCWPHSHFNMHVCVCVCV